MSIKSDKTDLHVVFSQRERSYNVATAITELYYSLHTQIASEDRNLLYVLRCHRF